MASTVSNRTLTIYIKVLPAADQIERGVKWRIRVLQFIANLLWFKIRVSTSTEPME